MTFWEISQDYERQYTEAQLAYQAFRNSEAYRTGKKYEGFEIDYAKMDQDMIQAVKDEFGFTDAQAWFIHGEAYDRYHSHYGDMAGGMRSLCKFVSEFNKLKG